MAAGALESEQKQANPLTEGLERLPVPGTTLTIFGATGDLARRKLLPALYNLAHEGALPERFHLVGVSRSDQEHEEFRAMAREAITQFSRRECNDDVLDKLLDEVRYIPGKLYMGGRTDLDPRRATGVSAPHAVLDPE